MFWTAIVVAGSLAAVGCNPSPMTEDEQEEKPAPVCGTDECQEPDAGQENCDCDQDHDGYLSVECGGNDCDDLNPMRHPGAQEQCNGRDDNCDGRIDDDPSNVGLSCVAPYAVGACQAGKTACEGGAIVCPAADPIKEICGNGIDDDCDGQVDEGCNQGGGGSGGSAGSGGAGGYGGQAGHGGSGGSAGSGGQAGQGGSGGQAGQGGAGGSGGSAGSGGAGGSGGQAGQGGAGGSGGSGGQGGTGGGGPVLKTLHIEVFSLDQSKPHTYAMWGYETPQRQGLSWAWNAQANVTQTGYYLAVDITVAQGATFVYGGTTDGVWWSDGPYHTTSLVATEWDGKWIQRVLPNPSNGNTGYNLSVIANPQNCPNDADCDGYTSDVDCNDNDPLVHPGQSETWGDAIDMNCDGLLDPASDKFVVAGLGQGYQVQVVDASSWSNGDFTVTYPMGFDANQLVYSVTVGSWVAPHEYVVRYRLNGNNAWLWDPWKNGNSCVTQLSHQVRETVDNSIIPYFADPNHNCHLFKQ